MNPFVKLFNKIRKAGGTYYNDNSSGFKGSEAEHEVVELEKKVWEKARMLFAIDIKISQAVDDGVIDSLKRERAKIESKLVDAIDTLNLKSSKSRYQQFMERLDEEDEHRRNKWGLAAA